MSLWQFNNQMCTALDDPRWNLHCLMNQTLKPDSFEFGLAKDAMLHPTQQIVSGRHHKLKEGFSLKMPGAHLLRAQSILFIVEVSLNGGAIVVNCQNPANWQLLLTEISQIVIVFNHRFRLPHSLAVRARFGFGRRADSRRHQRSRPHAFSLSLSRLILMLDLTQIADPSYFILRTWLDTQEGISGPLQQLLGTLRGEPFAEIVKPCFLNLPH